MRELHFMKKKLKNIFVYSNTNITFDRNQWLFKY